METNEFGMEAIINSGMGFTDSSFYTKKSNFDGDFDSLSLEVGSTENLINFAETYNQLDAYNADQKIRMLRKLQIHTNNVPGKFGASVENFIIEQSLEADAEKAAAGENPGAKPTASNPKVGEQRTNFLKTIWEKIKAFFLKIVNWFREKIKSIVEKIGKRPNTQESIQALTTCTNEESKDIWETIMSTDVDASAKSSDAGKVICISPDAINTFAKTTEKFSAVGKLLITCSEQVSKQGGYIAKNGDSHVAYNDLVRAINNIHSTIVSVIPGAKQVPATIQDLSKEKISQFNREFKECVSYLKWDHDPEGYAKLFTGKELVSKKAGSDAKSIAAAQYGTTNPSELRKNIPSMTESLKTIESVLNTLSADVKNADAKFQSYLKDKDRGILNKNGELNEYNGDNKDAIIVYQFATTTMVCFRLLTNLVKIATDVCTKMTSELTSLTNCLDSAAAAKKAGKWYQFAKRLRGGKASNDELKSKGLDTENEEFYDKTNKVMDGANKAGEVAGKAGKKVSEGAQAFGKTKAGTGLRNAADAITSGVKSTAQDLLGRDKEAANTRKNLEKRITKRDANAEKRAKEASKSRMAKDNAKTKTTESWLLNPEDYI